MPILRKDCPIRRDVEAGSAVFGEGVFTRCALSLAALRSTTARCY